MEKDEKSEKKKKGKKSSKAAAAAGEQDGDSSEGGGASGKSSKSGKGKMSKEDKAREKEKKLREARKKKREEDQKRVIAERKLKKEKEKECRETKFKRKFAQVSLWGRIKWYFCWCCIKELPQKPYRRVQLDDEEKKDGRESVLAKRVKTPDDHATVIEALVRGFLGRVKAKKAWKAAFKAVDDYWSNALSDRLAARDGRQAAAVARQQFVFQYVNDVVSTSYMFLVQNDAVTSIQSRWRGYYYRSRNPRIKPFKPIRWKPRKIKPRHPPEVYRRVWARKEFLPEGGWPALGQVLEYDMWEHIDKPPDGPQFGLRVFKVKAPAKTEQQQMLAMNDHNAWVGFPVYLDTARDVELQRQAKWSHLEYTTNTRTPYLTQVVNGDREFKPPSLKGSALMKSLGFQTKQQSSVDWGAQKGIPEDPEERDRLIRRLTRIDKMFKDPSKEGGEVELVDNILTRELTAEYANQEYAYANELKGSTHPNAYIKTVGLPLRARPPPPDHSGDRADLGNTVTHDSLTGERVVVPSFNSMVMETPNRGAYKPLNYMHKDNPDRSMPLPRNPHLTDADYEDMAAKQSFSEVKNVQDAVLLSTVAESDFRGTDSATALLEQSSYRPENAFLQFSMDPKMVPTAVPDKLTRQSLRSVSAYSDTYNNVDTNGFKTTAWGQLKNTVEQATANATDVNSFLDPNQETEIGFTDEDVWSRALYNPRKVVKSKARVWSVPPREHYTFRYSWLPQPLATPLSRPGGSSQPQSPKIASSSGIGEPSIAGSSLSSPTKDHQSRSRNTYSNGVFLGKPDDDVSTLGGRSSVLDLQSMPTATTQFNNKSTSKTKSSWGPRAPVPGTTGLSYTSQSHPLDQGSFYTRVDDQGRLLSPSTANKSNKHQQRNKSIAANEDRELMDDSSSDLADGMMLNRRSRAVDRVDVYLPDAQSHSDIQLSDLTGVVREAMHNKQARVADSNGRQRVALLKRTPIRRTANNGSNTNSDDDDDDHLDLDVGVSASPSMDSFSSHVFSSDPMSPLPGQSITASASSYYGGTATSSFLTAADSSGKGLGFSEHKNSKKLAGTVPNRQHSPNRISSKQQELHPYPFY